MAKPELHLKYKPDDYAYAVGVVQARQNEIIGADTFHQMAEAPSLDAALRFLAETPYGKYLADGLSYQEVGKAHLKDLRELHSSLVSGDLLTGLMFVVTDFANLKYLVKAFIKRMEPDVAALGVGWHNPEVLVDLVYEQPAKVGPEEAVYYSAAMRAFSEYERTADPAVIDLVLDHACYDYLDAICRFRQAKFAWGYLALQVDLSNLQTLFRLLNRRDCQGVHPTKDQLELAFLPHGTISRAKFFDWLKLDRSEALAMVGKTRYGRTLAEAFEKLVSEANWVSVEKCGDELKVAYLRRAKLVATGYQPVLAYFLAKENEVRQVRVALNGKAFGLPAAIIRERLWSSYV